MRKSIFFLISCLRKSKTFLLKPVLQIRFISRQIRIRFREKRIRPTFLLTFDCFYQKYIAPKTIFFTDNGLLFSCAKKKVNLFFIKYSSDFGLFFVWIVHNFGSLFAIRIRFMKRIRIREAEMKRIHTDPDPQHCLKR